MTGPDEPEITFGDALLALTEHNALLCATAEGMRADLTGKGWDDNLAQHVAAAWLVKQLTS